MDLPYLISILFIIVYCNHLIYRKLAPHKPRLIACSVAIGVMAHFIPATIIGLMTGKFLVSILAEGWLILVLPVYVLISLSCLFAAVIFKKRTVKLGSQGSRS
jgi:hypothetical protein